MTRLLCLLVAVSIAPGCVRPEEKPPHLLDDAPLMHAPPAPLYERPEPAPGSLWQGDESRRFLAFENRAKRIGDLLSVLISEQASAENEAKTELARESDFEATVNSDVALQTLISRPIRGVLSLFGFTDQRTDKNPSGELSVIDAATTSDYTGEGKLERSANFVTKIACVVTDVTPSGLLHIEGERHLTINGETQIIELSGFVRPEDVRIDNTLPSELVASADIRYGGVGVVSEEQRMPWLTRLMRLALPF